MAGMSSAEQGSTSHGTAALELLKPHFASPPGTRKELLAELARLGLPTLPQVQLARVGIPGVMDMPVDM